MKNLLILAVVMVFGGALSAEEKDSAKMPMGHDEHIQMHEKMSKAHHEAAECLKSGKPEEECKTAFHKICEDSGKPEMCGHSMEHHKKTK